MSIQTQSQPTGQSTLDSFRRQFARISPPALALILAILTFIVGGIVKPQFANPDQAINIVRLAAFLGIIAAGQTLVIISGSAGIDLSVGAVVTLAAILTFRISDGQNGQLLIAIPIALAVGATIGFLNGVGITLIRIPPLVMTLSMAGMVAGAVRAVTRGQLEGETPPILGDLISRPLIGDLPGVIFLWLIFGVAMWLLLERTAYGKQLFAIGVNRTTARLSGIRVQWISLVTYTLSGLLAALAGVILLAFSDTVFLNLGDKYLFPAIAAVVIGGTALSGGRGTYWGTMSGALLLQVIQSLLLALGIDEAYQNIITGLTLLALLSLYGRERKLRQ